MLRKALRSELHGLLSFLVIAAVLCALLPAAVFLLPATPVFADSEPYTGQTTTGNYTIETATQLAKFAQMVNTSTSNNYTSSYFTLTANIDLSQNDSYPGLTSWVGGTGWTPIGGNCTITAYEEGVPTGGKFFSGIFDGDNYSISGINISTTINPPTLTGAVGLFGWVNGGTIANLSVAGSINMYTNPICEVGGVVGYTTGSLYNLHSSMTVYSANTSNWNSSQIGGIAGVVENNDNETTLKVQYCSNSGNVTGRGRVAGIVGGVYCVSNGGVLIDQCYNTGYIKSVHSSVKIFSGGIVGYCRGYISNCYNRGDLENNNGHYLGGITGILTSYYPDAPIATMENCYSTANFSGSSSSYDHTLWAYADGGYGVEVTDCVYVEINPAISQPTTSDYGTCDNVTEVTWAYLADPDIIDLLGSAFDFKEGEEYPVLGWQKIPDFKMTGLTSGTPSATFTDNDDPAAIFLDGTASTNGTGAKSSPFNNFASAKDALTSSNNTIYITGQVTVNGTDVWDLSAVSGTPMIMRSCTYSGHLVDVVTGGDLTLQNITFDGNNSNVTTSGGSLVSAEGGYLTVGSNTTLQNNYANSGGAIRIENSGNVTMTGGTITGNSAVSNNSTGVAVYGGSFTITPGGGTFNIANNIFLVEDLFILVGATVSGISGNLNVLVADPDTDRVVAQGTGGYTFDPYGDDLGKFVRANSGWHFELNEAYTQIVMKTGDP